MIFKRDSDVDGVAVTHDEDVEKVIQSLDFLRGFRDDLAFVSRCVEGEIRALRSTHQSRILKRGLDRIPDEILAEIFEHGYAYCDTGNDDAIRWSHVCKRFRGVTLGCPLL